MSSLIAYLYKDSFVIATDTLAHAIENDKIKPVNFCSKTFYLPQHKCCFAGQGILAVLNQCFLFAQEKVIGKDIKTLVNQITNEFQAHIASDLENFATLYFFGVNDLSNELEAYRIIISKTGDNTNEKIPLESWLHKPGIDGIENILNDIKGKGLGEKIFILMKEQKRQDEMKPISTRSVIGGQIQMTGISYDDQTKEVDFLIKTINAFEDFSNTYHQMF